MKNIPKNIALIFCTTISVNVYCQHITSPYSILGIGDIETKDFGRWFGMGSTSIALKSAGYINSSNPASLIGLDKSLMHFDLAARGKFSNYTFPNNESESSSPSLPDLAIRRITFAYRSEKKSAFAFGLKPFSTVNYYLVQNNTVLDNKTELTKIIDGSGGTYQAYATYARKLSSKLSFGITTSYLFGSLIRSTQYYNDDLSLNIERNEYDRLHTFQFQAGIQYSGKLSKRIIQHVGVTVSNPATFKRSLTTEYKDQDLVINTKTENKNNVYLPLSVGAGYALQFNNKITLSADMLFSNWKKQKIEYHNSYTYPSQRTSFGFEYSKKKRVANELYEKWYLQLGFSAETNYFYVEGKLLKTKAFTLGAGKTFSRRMSGYLGLETGTKGDHKTSKQISESFAQVVIGFTLKEFWPNTRKYGRYD
jgi:predicted nucleotidyltransferase